MLVANIKIEKPLKYQRRLGIGLTMTYFMAKSKLVSYALIYIGKFVESQLMGKTLNLPK